LWVLAVAAPRSRPPPNQRAFHISVVPVQRRNPMQSNTSGSLDRPRKVRLVQRLTAGAAPRPLPPGRWAARMPDPVGRERADLAPNPVDRVDLTVWGMTATLAVTEPHRLNIASRMLTDELASMDAACSRFSAPIRRSVGSFDIPVGSRRSRRFFR
jgi:hypothetical protein